MMKRVLLADGLKLKRTSLPIVLLLVPLLVLAYELINLTYRSEYVVKQAELFKANSLWEYLLFDNSLLFGLGFPLVATISASMIVNIEHQSNSWKAVLSQPVSRAVIYLSKFLWILLGLTFSVSFFFIGTLLLGKVLGFEGDIPLWLILGDSYSILFTTLPIVSFQLWLSITFKNQAFSIIIGAVSSMMGLFLAAGSTTRWMPLAYPVQSSTISLQYEGLSYNGDLSAYIIINTLVGIILLVIGLIHFTRRDI
ncbi:ABC transporter permease [Bacillus xiapuensis]|uniref:ABC transporter permease n=1 Tax=Bacillus xiapuensis TaxID=2014075 RepID=UPI001E558EFA|nr:ABC transporter permease [Bacillus xiapuensis]